MGLVQVSFEAVRNIRQNKTVNDATTIDEVVVEWRVLNPYVDMRDIKVPSNHKLKKYHGV